MNKQIKNINRPDQDQRGENNQDQRQNKDQGQGNPLGTAKSPAF